MKAIVCNDFGPIKNIKYMDVENPEIDDESILINVCLLYTSDAADD